MDADLAIILGIVGSALTILIILFVTYGLLAAKAAPDTRGINQSRKSQAIGIIKLHFGRFGFDRRRLFCAHKNVDPKMTAVLQNIGRRQDNRRMPGG